VMRHTLLLSDCVLPSPSSVFFGVSGPRLVDSFPARRSSDLFKQFIFFSFNEFRYRNTRPLADDKTNFFFSNNFSDNEEETGFIRSEEHTSELQSRFDLVCRLLREQRNRDRVRLCDGPSTSAI